MERFADFLMQISMERRAYLKPFAAGRDLTEWGFHVHGQRQKPRQKARRFVTASVVTTRTSLSVCQPARKTQKYRTARCMGYHLLSESA
jgi:hypothetical protein